MKNLIVILVFTSLFDGVSAQTWIRQNPFPKLVELLDIDFDGPYGLTVGQDGTCFTTDDGGVSWKPRPLPLEAYTYEAAHVLPGTNGQTMYAGGVDLIVTRDGGASWTQAYGSLGQIHKIQSLPGGVLMVHGASFSIYSSDQGDNWQVIETPDDDVSAAHFIDLQRGWVESGNFNNARVWVTEDGGQHWEVRDTTRHPVISSIHMLNDQVGFMAARDFVYKTTDGGHQWTAMHSNTLNSIQDMYVVNEQAIWTCLINGFIFYTTDGGNQWTETNPNIISSNKTNGIYANAEGHVWATGKFVSILHSSDLATTWTDQIPNSKSIMYQPNFLNEEEGLVGGSAGTILWTKNGGASWDKIQLGEDENFFAVDILNSQMAVGGSSSGRVFATANGGQDWQIIGDNLGQIVDIHAFSEVSAVAIAESGAIWRTVNTGADWDNVHNASGGLLQGLHFVDELGWACGWFGQILHSSDGGITWETQATQTNTSFVDIHFTSRTHGWAISSSFIDSVWHTSNGGASWESMKLPFSTFWQGVSFHSQDTGWITGGSAGSGTIIRTNDGGITWEWDHQSPEAFFGIYAVPGKETVWSSGVGGNIVKYSPCTFNPQIHLLSGPDTPCQRDTVTYEVTFSDVDEFIWTHPSDWLVFGNSNTSSIQFIVGSQSGEIRVAGRDGCGTESAAVSSFITPLAVPEAIITESGAFLICELTGVGYQWLFDGSPIPGADGPSFAPGSNGPYAVMVTLDNGCEVISNTIQFTVTSLNPSDLGVLRVFPNPARDWVFVEMSSLVTGLQPGVYALYDLQGRKVGGGKLSEGGFRVHQEIAGLYLLEISMGGNRWKKLLVFETE